nr:Chain AA, coat protein [Beihai levi-like virus 32]6YFG_AB Chain AB, coat protein [Beihai levi-like virus 32]6YFG_AC Chain AC, coat protein [Beihai levi-like virus 32]6YFG_AD Chain AD, coat protein [Beihai levi-like virus 32]6YFG_AE Chain AE, coat protein [Beihai levi-like virus 32]6YFG_AF Chain AF, coat protein [Beihai levi-like virus 32]6YFG_AG Chain AG, coat protein [Beihai levi-like virus 32]6YFG_AH Chain AH, coat protein [Beihai levi-like virus 32]6YFG_AI Chain AI, coat protein [Beih
SKPIAIFKLRELSSDSTLFTLPGHSVTLPNTLGIVSHLPTPRKGNPGTVKTMRNLRKTILLGAGTASERAVPIVIKTETSFPVGTTEEDRAEVLKQMASFLIEEVKNNQELAYSGYVQDKYFIEDLVITE